jgi:hypothetical protein
MERCRTELLGEPGQLCCPGGGARPAKLVELAPLDPTRRGGVGMRRWVFRTVSALVAVVVPAMFVGSGVAAAAGGLSPTFASAGVEGTPTSCCTISNSTGIAVGSGTVALLSLDVLDEFGDVLTASLTLTAPEGTIQVANLI